MGRYDIVYHCAVSFHYGLYPINFPYRPVPDTKVSRLSHKPILSKGLASSTNYHSSNKMEIF